MNFKISLFVGFFMMLASFADGALECPPGIIHRSCIVFIEHVKTRLRVVRSTPSFKVYQKKHEFVYPGFWNFDNSATSSIDVIRTCLGLGRALGIFGLWVWDFRA